MFKRQPRVILLLKRKSGTVWRRLFQIVPSAELATTSAAPKSLDRVGSTGGPDCAFTSQGTNGLSAHLRPAGLLPGVIRPALGAPIPLYQGLKRALDFGLALGLFVVTAPLTLLAMVLVKLSSRGPALYCQTRVGLDGRPFTIFKVRTMVHQCESLTGARWSTPGDSRVTTIGRFLRKSHLDELPQLWNVLIGDMSLVGPRPERPEFVPQLEQAVPHYRARLLVRPGVTGLAQLQLPPDTDLASVRRKVAYDIYYVQRAALLLDLRLVVGTALKMAGMPFGTLRWLLCLPEREIVEKTYGCLPGEPRTFEKDFPQPK